MTTGPMRIAGLRALVFRAPIEAPVRTSFGTMRERPALLVRAEDRDGVVGWGEVWCNFPAVGAEHRARLLASVVAPLVIGRSFATPPEVFDLLTRESAVLAIQSGEPGPLAQVIAGVDIALWDLAARRAGVPLWRLLGGNPRVSVYASGLNPDRPEVMALRKRDAGFRAFKLKVGFGRDTDLANLSSLRAALGDEAPIMVDANQAWSLAQAIEMVDAMQPFRPAWLEEPIRADEPLSAWISLASASPIALAAGENQRGSDAFTALIESGAVRVLQPDPGKWGGFTGCVEVGRRAVAAGLSCSPHWLGGGIGLVASMHLLAGIGGDGMVEIDSNDNPLREALARPQPAVREGRVELGEAPGLGVEPDLEASRRYAVTSATV